MVLTLPDSHITPWHDANITILVHYSLVWCYYYNIRTLLPGMLLTLHDSYITPLDGANITIFVHYSPAWC